MDDHLFDEHEERPRGYTSDFTRLGSAEGFVGLQLSMAILAAAAKIQPVSKEPLRIERSESVAWLRERLIRPPCSAESHRWVQASLASESPIEVVMFLGLCASFAIAKFPMAIVEAGSSRDHRELPDREVIVELSLQEPVSDYRIDVGIQVACNVGGALHQWRVAIECDGEDYHTSEQQVIHDAGKDAFLCGAGWLVYRFSGTHIWRDISNCCAQVIEPIFNKCRTLAARSTEAK